MRNWKKGAIPQNTPERPEPEEYLGAIEIDKLPLLVPVSMLTELLGVGRNTIYQLVVCGELSAIRFGPHSMRVFRESLRDYLRRNLL